MQRNLLAIALVLGLTCAAIRCTSGPPTAGTATVSEYCGIADNYVVACEEAGPCATAEVSLCPARAATFSPQGLGVLALCSNGFMCGPGGTAGLDTCSQYWLGTVTASAAQTKLAQGYCAACLSAGETPAACASAFYISGEDAGEQVTLGPGYALLPMSDELVTSVDSQCVPKASDASDAGDAGSAGCTNFLACELALLDAATPAMPASCAVDASVSTGTDAMASADASASADSD
jgi:hypothetical protein